jgi:hypothetical protein
MWKDGLKPHKIELHQGTSCSVRGVGGQEESENGKALDFLAIWEARKRQSNSSNLSRKNDFQPEIPYTAKLLITYEGKIKAKTVVVHNYNPSTCESEAKR